MAVGGTTSPRHDFAPLYKNYSEVIVQMQREFTSHEFILRLAQQNQANYVEALYAYRADNPFQVVHGFLSQRLHQHTDLIEHLGSTSSRDIFGQSNGCGRWRRRD